MKRLPILAMGMAIAVQGIASATLAAPRIPKVQTQPLSPIQPSRNQPMKSTIPKPQVPGGSGVLGNRCPQGQTLSSWQKPIYDNNGLFVIGWETVATCIPVNLEPAG